MELVVYLFLLDFVTSFHVVYAGLELITFSRITFLTPDLPARALLRAGTPSCLPPPMCGDFWNSVPLFRLVEARSLLISASVLSSPG